MIVHMLNNKVNATLTSGVGTPETGHSSTTHLSTIVLGLYTTFDSSIEGGTARDRKLLQQLVYNVALYTII